MDNDKLKELLSQIAEAKMQYETQHVSSLIKAMELIDTISSPLEREIYAMCLASMCGVSVDAIIREVKLCRTKDERSTT